MLNTFKRLFTREELLKGNFGIEREALRVNENGELSLTNHPKIFGSKLENPYVTVDFAESQVEVITPTFHSIKDTYRFLDKLYDYVALNIENEYLWPQSMPSIIPDDKDIKIASFEDTDMGQDAMLYRKKLVEKYGAKKQLISGIHYNFSFDEHMLETLYKEVGIGDYRSFKDEFYLKVARNYLRYRWVVVYLLGASPIVHKSYDEMYTKGLNKLKSEEFSDENSISYRNCEVGYENLVDIYPSYDSVDKHVNSIREYISRGILYNHKELYSQIRLKAKNNNDFFGSLLSNGINYLEVRNIDINPFEKSGVAFSDLEFLNMFFIFLSIKDETSYEHWQEDAKFNQRTIARYGLGNIKLKKDGKLIDKEVYLKEILLDIKKVNDTLNLEKEHIIENMLSKVENKEETYAYRFRKESKKYGYVDYTMSLAKKHVKEIQTKDNKVRVL